jgi:signal transduction histidine kinase
MERTILVAEDSPTQAERLRLLLESDGYRVDVVPNGRAGLQRVRLSPPDLIISDVMMPEMDGWAFCRAVKSVERTRRIPFVLLTQQNTPMDVIKGLEHGADNFIPKPFEDDQLLDRLRSISTNLALREQGRLDVEITLRLGGRDVTINADKQQMVELLFATLDELVRTNERLEVARRTIEEHATDLEAKVQQRTEQLLQAEKLATMGNLLAGVAHELNNPLSVVLGHALLLHEAADSGVHAQRAAKITTAAERCARIVKNFLALARSQPPERRQVRLNLIVQEAIELLAYQLRVDDVEVRFDLAPDLPPILADPHQLHQVVLNLATNAHYAMRRMPTPRVLTIATRFDGAHGRVTVEVTDTGPGIPAEVERRLFEPFFTTKPPGEGTGLGLSLCQAMIESHQGTIRVTGRPGQGAGFLIELPVAQRAAESAAQVPPPAGHQRSKAILVVDDELEVGDMLAELLAADHHEVDVVRGGAEALDKLRERTYDVIVSDIKMPGLDGPGLYREVERLYPGLERRFIFMTGDTLSREVREFLEGAGALSVSKPFDPAEMRRTVNLAHA